MAGDTGNSEPLCPLWWLMVARCYIIALLTQWVILSKMNSKAQILKTILSTYSTCQKHTRTKKNISSTHVKHIENIQNIKSKQNHMFKLYIESQFWICETDTYSGTQQNKTPLWIPWTVACSKALNLCRFGLQPKLTWNPTGRKKHKSNLIMKEPYHSSPPMSSFYWQKAWHQQK